MARLFFALQPTEAERLAMHEGMLPLVREAGARPVAAEDLHLTLCFLGEVPETRVQALIRAADAIVAIAARLSFGHIDLWPRSRVLCLLAQPDEMLQSVGELASALRQASLDAGLAPDPGPFRAHVTLARKAPAKARPDGHWPRPVPVPLTLTANGFVLMHSTGAGNGPRYGIQRSWPASC